METKLSNEEKRIQENLKVYIDEARVTSDPVAFEDFKKFDRFDVFLSHVDPTTYEYSDDHIDTDIEYIFEFEYSLSLSGHIQLNYTAKSLVDQGHTHELSVIYSGDKLKGYKISKIDLLTKVNY